WPQTGSQHRDPPGSSRAFGKAAQHEVQDAAVLEIVELVERVDARKQRDGALRSVAIGDFGLDPLAWVDLAQALQAHRLDTGQAERLPGGPFREHERQYAHADQVRAVDALEAFGDHRPDAEEPRALRRPVARGASAIFLPREDHERHALARVADRRVVYRQMLAGRIVHGDAAFDALYHHVLDAVVGERPAHNHLVIAARRAVGVEVVRSDTVGREVLPRRAVLPDRAGRRDMVGGDRIEEKAEDAGVDDIGHRLWRAGEIGEVRR